MPASDEHEAELLGLRLREGAFLQRVERLIAEGNTAIAFKEIQARLAELAPEIGERFVNYSNRLHVLEPLDTENPH